MDKKHYERKIAELEEENEVLSRAQDILAAEVVAVTASRDEWIAQFNRVNAELESFRSHRFDRGSRLAS